MRLSTKVLKIHEKVTTTGKRYSPCTNLIISGFFTSNPKALIRTFSSCMSIEPVLSESNSSNASLNSCFWSSVSSCRDYRSMMERNTINQIRNGSEFCVFKYWVVELLGLTFFDLIFDIIYEVLRRRRQLVESPWKSQETQNWRLLWTLLTISQQSNVQTSHGEKKTIWYYSVCFYFSNFWGTKR